MKSLSHKCGCEIVNLAAIDMCPLHFHAHELLEALNNAISMIQQEYCSHTANCRPGLRDCYVSKFLKVTAKIPEARS